MSNFNWTRYAKRATQSSDPDTYYTLVKDGVPFGWVTAEWEGVDNRGTKTASYTYTVRSWMVESRDDTPDMSFDVSRYGSAQVALKFAKEELARRAMKK
jgi:hypothetical protein